MRYGFVIDHRKCIGCHACTVACKEENRVPLGAFRTWVKYVERGTFPDTQRYFSVLRCNHCDDAPCMNADKTGAISKRDDGIVLIDPVKAKGQRQLVEACPYGHIWWNDELGLPQHWPFDAHLIDQGWDQTRGHQSCPTGAMRAIKITDEEMARMVREEGLEVMRPELGSRPRVYYRNFWRYAKCFIGGTLSTERDGMVDCLEGAAIRLMKGGTLIVETASDNYGDFKFDRLDEDSGRYLVEISASGRAKKTVEANLGSSINLGEIRL